MEKDSKHAGFVEEVGGCFFPLVTETLGVWTPSSLFLLCTFAERTILRNCLSPSIAALKLIQQLSVKLWSYNADNGPSFKCICVICLISIVPCVSFYLKINYLCIAECHYCHCIVIKFLLQVFFCYCCFYVHTYIIICSIFIVL